MAKITLARALKEKNRIAGQIRVLWDYIKQENSRREDEERTIDVRKTFETIELYTEKLVELKTKIGIANAGHVGIMFRLEECKSKMAQLREINTDESPVYLQIYSTGGKQINRTAVITKQEIRELQSKLQSECNKLQDALDDYNAQTRIDFETPLQ